MLFINDKCKSSAFINSRKPVRQMLRASGSEYLICKLQMSMKITKAPHYYCTMQPIATPCGTQTLGALANKKLYKILLLVHECMMNC